MDVLRAGSWRALLATLVCVLALAACSGDDDGGRDDAATSAGTAPVTVAYAYEQEFTSYNNNTAQQAGVRNAVVLNQVLSGFWFADARGAVQPDGRFGTVTKTSDRPLTVRYTVNPEAVWSDGVPISCADFVLAWAARSGKWPTGKRDPVTGDPLTLFRPTSTVGYEQAEMPRCAAGDRSFDLVYQRPYADWRAMFGGGQVLPAHVVEKQTGVDVIPAVKAGDLPKLRKVAAFWNTGWSFKPGSYETELAPSSGPYQVASWAAGESITLEPNPRWWGPPPRARTVVVRIVPADRQVAALAAGDVQVMDPLPTAEVLGRLKKLGGLVTVTTGDRFDWEHLDVNFDRMFSDARLREAFARCVPRQNIVDNLIKPLNPRAQVLDSRFLLPFQAGYDRLAATGGKTYAAVDVAGAKKLLAGSGRSGVSVTIGYQTPDPRRRAVVDLIRDSCGKAGFTIRDGGSSTFYGNEMRNGDYDVALFAWSGSAQVGQPAAVYSTGGALNFSGYSRGAVDETLKKLAAATEPDAQLALRAELDTQLWKDLVTIPLFAHPALLATTAGVRGPTLNAGPAELTWNAHDWALS